MKTILAIPGSIRKESYNKAICSHLETLSSGEVSIKSYHLDHLPMFNEDLEEELPEEVNNFVNAINAADALIFSTPEYNNMLPGVLKNACEWLTRPYSSEAVKGKPVAITGASTGGFGTVRAQNQLMLLANIMKLQVDASLRLPISNAGVIFNETGTLVDEEVAQKLQELVDTLAAKV